VNRPPPWLLCSALALAAGGARAQATAASERAQPLFSIAKSENKNQVQYAVRVDEHCAPVDASPIFAYWKMFEKGPSRTEPLLPQEIDAYGIASQQVSGRSDEGGSVRLVLRAVRGRPILVDTWRASSGECQASAKVSIGGAPAYLYNVYAKLKWPLGVDYLLLQGWSLDRAHVVTEKIRG
jgi:hypothetical protein